MDLRCSNCGKDLKFEYDLEEEEGTVVPCEPCLDEAYNEGNKEGYEEGYNDCPEAG